MSKTFTSKSSVSYARGRGARQTNETTGRPRPVNRETSPARAPPQGQPPAYRGRGRGVATNGRGGASTVRGRGMDAPKSSAEQSEPPPQEQRMSHQGGFTMITPNEKKRQAVSEQAKRGLDQYDAHKQQQKLGHVSYVGTAGGGQMTMAESRQRMVDGNRFGKTDRLQKQQQYKDERKQKEETEFEKKKMQQRMKAETNKQREATRQSQDHMKYDEDRRRKNEEFLKKLEGQSRQPGVSTSGNVASTDNSPLRLAAPAISPDSQCQRSYEHVQSSPGGQSSSHSTENEATGGQISQLETLMSMFPMYSTDILCDILNQTDNNLDQAVQLLTQ
ncbi:epithelial-stromal interaction protein 1-like [Pecten maximus]|uniref:epithelial-stromal interaction protein 1-like n=1 Tax=Pecten maximus TaxID=6579 RepID=UPI001457FF16|nr:epithelial-stromal interaction protein 1-like [Pecten maximus]